MLKNIFTADVSKIIFRKYCPFIEILIALKGKS